MLVGELQTTVMEQLGHLRAPAEACGLLLTGPHAPVEAVVEVPNRAEDPTKNCVMTDADIQDALRRLTGDPKSYPGDLVRDLVVWHTHPGGMVGPSRVDMQFRRKLGGIRCLVVTLPGGEAVQF